MRGVCDDCYFKINEEAAFLTDIFEKVFPKRFELPNFTWISPSIQLPKIRLVKPSPDTSKKQYDFSNHFVEVCEIDSKYQVKFHFLMILEQIKLLSSNIALATTIKNSIKYEGLTLNPDGTLAF